jgi:hypothetical protein
MKHIFTALFIVLFSLSLFAGGFSDEDMAYLYKVCSRFNIDIQFMVAIAMEESNINFHARGNSGEVGAFQVKPSTFRWLRDTVTKLYPQSNLTRWQQDQHLLISHRCQIEAACLFVAWLKDTYGLAPYHVLVRYNASYRKYEYAEEVMTTYHELLSDSIYGGETK